MRTPQANSRERSTFPPPTNLQDTKQALSYHCDGSKRPAEKKNGFTCSQGWEKRTNDCLIIKFKSILLMVYLKTALVSLLKASSLGGLERYNHYLRTSSWQRINPTCGKFNMDSTPLIPNLFFLPTGYLHGFTGAAIGAIFEPYNYRRFSAARRSDIAWTAWICQLICQLNMPGWEPTFGTIQGEGVNPSVIAVYSILAENHM